MIERDCGGKMNKQRAAIVTIGLVLLISIVGMGWYQYWYIPSTKKWEVSILDAQGNPIKKIEAQKTTLVEILDEQGKVKSSIEIGEDETQTQLPLPSTNPKLLFQHWEIEFVDRKKETKTSVYHAIPKYIDAKDYLLTVQSDEHAKLIDAQGKDAEGKIIPYQKNTEVYSYLPKVVVDADYKGNWFYHQKDGTEIKISISGEKDEKTEVKQNSSSTETKSEETKNKEPKKSKDSASKEKSPKEKEDKESKKINTADQNTTVTFRTYQDKNNNNKDDFSETFTVKFHTDLKEVQYKDKTVKWEETLHLPILKDKQRVFFGWCKDPQYTQPFTEEDKVRENLNLYAEFRSIEEVMNRSVEKPILRQDVSLQVLKILEKNNKQVDLAYNKAIRQEEMARKKKEEENKKKNIIEPPKKTVIELHNVNWEKLYLITFIDEFNQYRFSFVSPYGRAIKIYDKNDTLLKEYAVRQNTTITLNSKEFGKQYIQEFLSEYYRFNDSIYIKISPKK